MNNFITKIWSFLINRRLRSFAKSPIINIHNFTGSNRKYFRLKSNCKVISVGNLSFGGTGKTPLISTLVNEFLPKDKKIGIVAKGYKRSQISDIIIHQGNCSQLDVEHVGDEPLLLFNHLNVPISISEKKYRGLYNLEKTINPDIAIIDDGYQHLWIERDLNILLLDDKLLNSLNKNKFILMREPKTSINRADVILIPLNHHFNYSNLESKPNKIIHFRFEVEKIKNEYTFKEKSRIYVAFAGIANPSRFFNTLYELNIDPVRKITFSDHYNYSAEDIAKLLKIATKRKADLITTEKDLVKLSKYKNLFEEYKVNLDCIYIKLEIIEKDKFLEIIKEKINV